MIPGWILTEKVMIDRVGNGTNRAVGQIGRTEWIKQTRYIFQLFDPILGFDERDVIKNKIPPHGIQVYAEAKDQEYPEYQQFRPSPFWQSG